MIALAERRDQSLGVEATVALLARAKNFLAAIDGQISREMQAWIAEFQSNLRELDRDLEPLPAAQERTRPEPQHEARTME